MTAPMAAKTCVRLGTPGPAPPLPWKEISVDLLLRIGGGKKAPGSSPAAWYSASVGPGRWEPCLSFFSPAHALTHRGQPLLVSLRTRARPLCPPGAEDDAPKPAWRWTRGWRARRAQAPEPEPRAVRESRTARPSCRTLGAPSRRSLGLGLGGPSTNHE